MSGTHSLLSSLSHSCINTLTHTENTRKSLSETGWACVGSEITLPHTFPLSVLQTVTVFVVCLCAVHLSIVSSDTIRGAPRCNFQGCQHLNEEITEDRTDFYCIRDSAATLNQLKLGVRRRRGFMSGQDTSNKRSKLRISCCPGDNKNSTWNTDRWCLGKLWDS